MLTIAVALSSGLWYRSYASRTAVSNVPGGFGSALRFVVSLLCQPDSGLKRARGVVIMPSDLWCRCYASREAVSSVPASDLWCRCYASRTAISNVPGGFWLCPPVCGVVVMPAGQRLQTCPGRFRCFLRLMVSLLCQPDSGFKRARDVYYCCAAALDLWCRCSASRTAVSGGPGLLCFSLRFVVSLLCKSDTGFKRARGVVVLPADLWFLCCASRTADSNVPEALWPCPPICGVAVIPPGQRLQKCPGCCGAALQFAGSLLCQPDSGFKRAWCVVVLPAKL